MQPKVVEGPIGKIDPKGRDTYRHTPPPPPPPLPPHTAYTHGASYVCFLLRACNGVLRSANSGIFAEKTTRQCPIFYGQQGYVRSAQECSNIGVLEPQEFSGGEKRCGRGKLSYNVAGQTWRACMLWPKTGGILSCPNGHTNNPSK